MKINDFFRVLEEIGLAAWHGDGRTTTVQEIEARCRNSGVGILLDAFEEGARAGVTRLLAAFFFRQYGQRTSGDPTFVFTHKSFGEYLTARRIVRAVERVNRELNSRAENPDGGWDERDALKHWAQICGPSAISKYLHVFLLNEMKLRPAQELAQWQGRLTKLFRYILRQGMPMEQLQIVPFSVAMFHSRNAEEALLVALNACAVATHQISSIEQLDPTAFGTWFKRIQGQRTSDESVLAAKCLSFLNLPEAHLYIADFYNSSLSFSNLKNAGATYACFSVADLTGVNLEGASLEGANLRGARLEGAILEGANLRGARLERASLEGANLKGANLEGAILEGANLRGASLEGANLRGARLEGTILEGTRKKVRRVPTKTEMGGKQAV